MEESNDRGGSCPFHFGGILLLCWLTLLSAALSVSCFAPQYTHALDPFEGRGLLFSHLLSRPGSEGSSASELARDKFLYVSSQAGNSIFKFDIGQNGELIHQTEITANSQPLHIIAHSTLNKLYVSMAASASINVYSIAEGNGELTLAQSFTSTINGPRGMTMTKDGKYLFAANNTSASITAMAIDQNTGDLSLVENETGGGSLNDITFLVASPNDNYLFATMQFPTNRLQPYSLSSGFLTNIGTGIGTPNNIYDIGIKSDGSTVYTANYNHVPDSVSAFSIAPGTGVASLLETETAANNASSVTVDPSSKFLFAGSNTTSTLSRFAIASDGSLSAVTYIPVNIANHYYGGFTSSGKFLFFTTSSNTVVSYSHNQVSGEISQVSAVNVGKQTLRLSVY
ncbi:MAG: beta-propeller fold lactonase family protein [Spirochaetales bacterium]|nr:beta-propeller fold lactonase family protein [Spirochaetales bacterium]